MAMPRIRSTGIGTRVRFKNYILTSCAVVLAACSAGVSGPVSTTSSAAAPGTTASKSQPGISASGAVPVAVDVVSSRIAYGLFSSSSGNASQAVCAYWFAASKDLGRHFSGAVNLDSFSCSAYPKLSKVAFGSSGDGFVYGPGLFVTHDYGKTFASVATAGSVVDIAIVGKSIWMLQVVCAGFQSPNVPAPDCTLKLSVSRDGGRTFSPATGLPAIQVPPRAATFEPALGMTWLIRPNATQAYLFAPPAGVQSLASVYYSDDRGQSWSRSTIPCEPGSMSLVASANPQGSLMAVCASQPAAGFQPKSVMVSSDHGKSWTVSFSCGVLSGICSHSPLEFGYLGGVVYLSPSKAFVIGDRTQLLATNDGGAIWEPVSSVSAPGGDTFGVSFFGTNLGYVVGDNGSIADTSIWSTTDGGASWAQVQISWSL